MIKRHLYKFIALSVAAVMLLTGCTSFVDLSEDESRQIVNYSTDVLSDHNSAVKGSLKNLTNTDLKDIVIKDDPTIIDEIEAAKEEATREAEEEVKAAEEESSGSGGGSESDGEMPPLEAQDADIASLIGLEGFRVDYAGHDVLDSYPAPSDEEEAVDMSFSIEPATANDKLLVLYFNVTNTGEEEAMCDILDLRPRFRFKAAGKPHSFLTTLLLDDLSTLQITLQPGESSRAVLTAELAEDKLSELSDITLVILGEEENTEIILEK